MRFRPDPFIVGIVAAAAIASVFPISDATLDHAHTAVKIAIGVLFFLYGARLSTGEALHGIRRWQLQIAIVATTFVLFPLLGLATMPLLSYALDAPLAAGILLICFLPSTVQSSITMTSIARGNIAGAVVGASLSNLLGVALTPLLVAVFVGNEVAQLSGNAVVTIVAILLLPFILGQLSRRWLSGLMERNGRGLRIFDRAAIIMVVYVAFSEGMSSGAWNRVGIHEIVWVVALCFALLTIVLAATYWGGRALNLRYEDRIALIFCGSQKSLSSGLPMASVLFDRADVALIVLPLMIYHQMQLIASSWFAGRWGRRVAPGEAR